MLDVTIMAPPENEQHTECNSFQYTQNVIIDDHDDEVVVNDIQQQQQQQQQYPTPRRRIGNVDITLFGGSSTIGSKATTTTPSRYNTTIVNNTKHNNRTIINKVQPEVIITTTATNTDDDEDEIDKNNNNNINIMITKQNKPNRHSRRHSMYDYSSDDCDDEKKTLLSIKTINKNEIYSKMKDIELRAQIEIFEKNNNEQFNIESPQNSMNNNMNLTTSSHHSCNNNNTSTSNSPYKGTSTSYSNKYSANKINNLGTNNSSHNNNTNNNIKGRTWVESTNQNNNNNNTKNIDTTVIVPDIVRASKIGYNKTPTTTVTQRRNTLFTTLSATESNNNEENNENTFNDDSSCYSNNSNNTEQNSSIGTSSTTGIIAARKKFRTFNTTTNNSYNNNQLTDSSTHSINSWRPNTNKKTTTTDYQKDETLSKSQQLSTTTEQQQSHNDMLLLSPTNFMTPKKCNKTSNINNTLHTTTTTNNLKDKLSKFENNSSVYNNNNNNNNKTTTTTITTKTPFIRKFRKNIDESGDESIQSNDIIIDNNNAYHSKTQSPIKENNKSSPRRVSKTSPIRENKTSPIRECKTSPRKEKKTSPKKEYNKSPIRSPSQHKSDSNHSSNENNYNNVSLSPRSPIRKEDSCSNKSLVQNRLSMFRLENENRSNSNRSLNSSNHSTISSPRLKSPTRKDIMMNNKINTLSNDSTHSLMQERIACFNLDKSNSNRSLNCGSDHSKLTYSSPRKYSNKGYGYNNSNNNNNNDDGYISTNDEESITEPKIITKTIITTTTTVKRIKKKKKKDGTIISSDVIKTDIIKDEEIILEDSNGNKIQNIDDCLVPTIPATNNNTSTNNSNRTEATKTFPFNNNANKDDQVPAHHNRISSSTKPKINCKDKASNKDCNEDEKNNDSSHGITARRKSVNLFSPRSKLPKNDIQDSSHNVNKSKSHFPKLRSVFPFTSTSKDKEDPSERDISSSEFDNTTSGGGNQNNDDELKRNPSRVKLRATFPFIKKDEESDEDSIQQPRSKFSFLHGLKELHEDDSTRSLMSKGWDSSFRSKPRTSFPIKKKDESESLLSKTPAASNSKSNKDDVDRNITSCDKEIGIISKNKTNSFVLRCHDSLSTVDGENQGINTSIQSVPQNNLQDDIEDLVPNRNQNSSNERETDLLVVDNEKPASKNIRTDVKNPLENKNKAEEREERITSSEDVSDNSIITELKNLPLSAPNNDVVKQSLAPAFLDNNLDNETKDIKKSSDNFHHIQLKKVNRNSKYDSEKEKIESLKKSSSHDIVKDKKKGNFFTFSKDSKKDQAYPKLSKMKSTIISEDIQSEDNILSEMKRTSNDVVPNHEDDIAESTAHSPLQELRRDTRKILSPQDLKINKKKGTERTNNNVDSDGKGELRSCSKLIDQHNDEMNVVRQNVPCTSTEQGESSFISNRNSIHDKTNTRKQITQNKENDIEDEIDLSPRSRVKGKIKKMTSRQEPILKKKKGNEPSNIKTEKEGLIDDRKAIDDPSNYGKYSKYSDVILDANSEGENMIQANEYSVHDATTICSPRSRAKAKTKKISNNEEPIRKIKKETDQIDKDNDDEVDCELKDSCKSVDQQHNQMTESKQKTPLTNSEDNDTHFIRSDDLIILDTTSSLLENDVSFYENKYTTNLRTELDVDTFTDINLTVLSVANEYDNDVSKIPSTSDADGFNENDGQKYLNPSDRLERMSFINLDQPLIERNFSAKEESLTEEMWDRKSWESNGTSNGTNSSFLSPSGHSTRKTRPWMNRSLSVSLHSHCDIERSAEEMKNKNSKKRRSKKDKHNLKRDKSTSTVDELSLKKPNHPKERKAISVPAVNDLKLHKILGEGSFGQVWLASFADLNTERKDVEKKRKERAYALKILSKFNLIQNSEVEALRNEINVLKAVRNQHPCVMNLVAATQDDNLIYLMQEFAQGGELFSLLHKHRDSDTGIGGIPEKQACFYAACISDALCFLHLKHHLVFRDLKPENVMLNKYGYPVIIDFGYAKFLDVQDPKTYTLVGTPRYMSPEVILSLGYDFGTDNWSLGVLIYELLSGFNPFEGPLGDDEDGLDEMELFESVVEEAYVPLPASASLSKEAEDIVAKLLTKEPTQRMGHTNSSSILDHDWFILHEIDFHSLRRRKLDPPWVPDIEGALDTRHFDNWDHLASNQDTCIIKNSYPKLTEREALRFTGIDS